jgi:hypothetical protein
VSAGTLRDPPRRGEPRGDVFAVVRQILLWGVRAFAATTRRAGFRFAAVDALWAGGGGGGGHGVWRPVHPAHGGPRRGPRACLRGRRRDRRRGRRFRLRGGSRRGRIRFGPGRRGRRAGGSRGGRPALWRRLRRRGDVDAPGPGAACAGVRAGLGGGRRGAARRLAARLLWRPGRAPRHHPLSRVGAGAGLHRRLSLGRGPQLERRGLLRSGQPLGCGRRGLPQGAHRTAVPGLLRGREADSSLGFQQRRLHGAPHGLRSGGRGGVGGRGGRTDGAGDLHAVAAGGGGAVAWHGGPGGALLRQPRARLPGHYNETTLVTPPS